MIGMNLSNHPPSGLWRPSPLEYLYYGEDVVRSKLVQLLPGAPSKVVIVTSNSLAKKSPLIVEIEQLLGPDRHAATIKSVQEHNPVAELEDALKVLGDELRIDTIISVGGLSSIDAAKWLSIKLQEARRTTFSMEPTLDKLTHICIPTTLSGAECTSYSVFTDEAGRKQTIGGDYHTAPTAIFYDPHFASYTPLEVWLSTGIRALDHAVELMYHPDTIEVPCKSICLSSAAALYQYLPKARWSHKGDGTCDSETTVRLFLAAFGSLQFMDNNMTQTLGLSHALSHAISVTCGIPHGETNCLTLGPVIKLKARSSRQTAEQIARLLPFVTDEGPIWEKADVGDEIRVDKALMVADTVLELVERLGLKKPLTKYGVDRDQVEAIVEATLGKPTPVVNGNGSANGSTHTNGTQPHEDQEYRKDVTRLVEGLFDWNDMNSYDSVHAENLLVNGSA